MENNQTQNYKKPINIVEVNYKQTGKSKATNELGMRQMQADAFEALLLNTYY